MPKFTNSRIKTKCLFEPCHQEQMLMSPDNQCAAGPDNQSLVTAGNGLAQAYTDHVLCVAFESASVWFWKCFPSLGTMAGRALVLGDGGGVHQLLILTPFFVRNDLYLWILAKGGLPPDRKKLASQCSSRDAPCLAALLVCSSVHSKSALGIFIHTSTNKCLLKTAGALHLYYLMALQPAPNPTAFENEILCKSHSYFFSKNITTPKQREAMTSVDSCVCPS